MPPRLSSPLPARARSDCIEGAIRVRGFRANDRAQPLTRLASDEARRPLPSGEVKGSAAPGLRDVLLLLMRQGGSSRHEACYPTSDTVRRANVPRCPDAGASGGGS